MGLRLKFNLVLVLVFLLGLGVTGYDFLRTAAQECARGSAAQRRRHDGGRAVDARLYGRQVRPVLQADPETFLPQSVPAFAATEIMTQLRKKYPDYAYKEAALNPTNPRNRAVEWETDIVNEFRNNAARTEISGMRQTPTGPSLYLARPFQIKDPACLGCHTTAEMAPPAMVKLYGTSNGFGWKLTSKSSARRSCRCR